ncbi:ABC transporter C member 13 [Linnemannia hyalina]|uniref:ABC transporter C member 13 n=1 Tax=Linnemannia hyalina TaxID=64524 RepID=A0A9P8BW10_9FUNG|nr:ABC transporter C member 13 [Linnemannia hyalina]
MDIKLSGGQKQRISIARAVYTNADVYILDDRHIFKHAPTTIPADKTCILFTNGVNHLKESLSHRQFMSLARTMLAKNTRVLCLDETTAAIDVETDNATQHASRREFQNCTVLTITHRINTIMGTDKILVLEHGRVAEFDSPSALLQKKDGHFYRLVSQSGNA